MRYVSSVSVNACCEKPNFSGALIAHLLLVLLVGCAQTSAPPEPIVVITAPTRADMEKLASMRVVFAHQSIGSDILLGLQKISAELSSPVSVTQTRQARTTDRGIFQFTVGQNAQPQTKIEEFTKLIDANAFHDPDVAMIKYSYADFDANMQGEKLAADYVAMLDGLQQRHPGTRFVAITSPLTVLQTGAKAWFRRMLGRWPGEYEANARRFAFNAVLRKHFDSTHLFDLARVESHAGNVAQTFSFEGRNVEALAPAFSEDGARLNDLGQRKLAAAMVNFLSRGEAFGDAQPAHAN